jgi:DNA-binding CsgD family transcriptional regulator
MAQEAVELARATGDGDAEAKVSAAWRQTHCAPELLEERLRVTDAAFARARAPEARAVAAIASVLDNLEAGRRAPVDRAMAELFGLSEATGDPALRWRTGQLATMLAFASGDLPNANRHLVETFVHGAQAGENGRWVVRTVQATLLSLEADDDPATTVAFIRDSVDELVYPPIRAGAVHALAVAGEVSEARRLVDDLVRRLTTDRDREASWLVTVAFTAATVALVGDARAATALLPLALPFADRIAVDGIGFHCAGCLGRPLARLAALVGDHELAATLSTTALDRDTAAGLHLWVLDGAIDDLAQRASAGAVGGAELRARASAIADEAARRGLLRIARRARALHRPTVNGELTARQRDVLVALAGGLTYQAAGERLGFSHSTIRHEAMRIYAALGAADRDEAVRIARRTGILPA